jgi:hypothetical protein
VGLRYFGVIPCVKSGWRRLNGGSHGVIVKGQICGVDLGFCGVYQDGGIGELLGLYLYSFGCVGEPSLTLLLTNQHYPIET